MTSAYIALGSNLSRPQSQLQQAVGALEALPDTTLVRVSSIYRSTAVGPGTQPDYLNAVLLLDTKQSPLALLDAMQQIEQEQGRVRNIRWGPRTLDLDLLLYGEVKITSLTLTVPHPRMQQRNFVLYPLREISDTNLVLPDGSDLDTLLQQCAVSGLVKTRYQLKTSQCKKSG
jgi:2-amino-4-hydroxy-6-hydroxymethyldihydropteridine diphosphokinase